MSAPVSSASRKRSTISTGMVRSASRNAMGSPRAASMPARTAAPLPRWGSRSTLKVRPVCPRAIFARWKISAVASPDQSPARMISAARALALSALPRLVVVAVLVLRPNREVHTPHPVDLGNLDLHRVPDLDDIFHAADSVGRELTDAHEPFLARKVLDERADAHDP